MNIYIRYCFCNALNKVRLPIFVIAFVAQVLYFNMKL